MTVPLNTIDNMAKLHRDEYVKNNLEVICKQYSWERLVEEHKQHFMWMMEEKKH